MQTFKSIIQKPSNAFYFHMGIIAFFGLVFLYMYFLSMSVVHVVLRKEVRHDIRTVESEIAMLEAKYIAAQHQVSDKIAALEDFSENDAKIFVSRDAETLVFSNVSR